MPTRNIRPTNVRFLRPVVVEGDVAYVPLTHGKTAIIDAEYAASVGERNWCAIVNRHVTYAATTIFYDDGSRKYEGLHRFVMYDELAAFTDKRVVDHINGNGLDCRKANLRIATVADNTRNSRRPRTNRSGFKGVSTNSGSKSRPYRAAICVNGKYTRLGNFSTPEEAAEAYIKGARRYYGEFARFDDGSALKVEGE